MAAVSGEEIVDKGTRLAGKVAIVTGGGSSGELVGTGQAAAILFARQGARVLVVDRDPANAGETVATIEAEGGQASLLEADVTDSEACQAIAESAVARYGALNILFNNVGLGGPRATVVEVDEEAWDQTLKANLKSTMLASKYAIPKMIEAGGGSIINIASVDGIRAGAWENVPYAAAKGAIVNLTSHMAVHHGRDNIRVNCIAPGMIHAPFVSSIPPQLRELRRRGSPLGIEGTAWDIAWAGVFFASDESRYISGVTMAVDGGLLAATPLSMRFHLGFGEDRGQQ